VGVRSTGVSQVVVEVVFIPAVHQGDQVAAELLLPSLNEELMVDFDGLDLTDLREVNDNTSDDDSVDRYSVMLAGPTIAQKLGP